MNTCVAIVQSKDTEVLVERALSLLGFEERFGPETRVFLKINAVRAPYNTRRTWEEGAFERSIAPRGDNTHPRFVEAALRALQRRGIENIAMGDGAGGCYTDIVYREEGWYDLAARYGARMVDLNYEPSLKLPIPQPYVLDYIWAPRVLLDSDLIISIPTLKTHGATGVTLSLKNMMGILPGHYYGWNKAASNRPGVDKPIPHEPVKGSPYGENDTVAGLIVDICRAVPIGLALIDGLTPLHGRGEVALVTDLTIAGFDPVAADAVGARVMGFDPAKMLMLRLAMEKGLGTGDLAQIELQGEPLARVEMHAKPPNRPGMEGLLLT